MRNSFVALFVFFSFSVYGNKISVDTSGNAMDDFNAIKMAITFWNDAINHRSLDELKAIYADEVQYYLVKRSATDCIKSKINWLNKRPKFAQTIKNISVYTIGNKNEKPDIIAEFKKECFDGVSTNEYDGLLVFRKVDNDWKLIKESDITTEVKRYYNSPLVNLSMGEYSFAREYFKYNKNIRADTTELLSYKYTLKLKISTATPPFSICGDLTIYSGAINSTTVYSVISATMNIGILQLITASKNEDGSVLESSKQTLRFKILKDSQLVLLNAEMPWLYGKPMVKINN